MSRRSESRFAGSSPVLLAVCLAVVLFGSSRLSAQSVLNPTEQIGFTRPEAWALKYFTSGTLLTGLEPPGVTSPGSITIGLELGWLPSLDASQRRVGFDGTKTEDLNKSPLFLRPRIAVGLPRGFSLAFAVVPPVRVFGLKPRLFAVALQRSIYEAPSWSLGLRGYAQTGTVEGAYTCPASVLPFAPGSPNNSYGCQAESSDKATLRFAGGELSVAYRPGTLHRLSPHAAVGVNYLDVGFQVNAQTFGYLDHTHLLTHGVTVSPSAGVTLPLTRKLGATVDVLFVPLSVRRSAGAPITDDPFLSARAFFTYRLR